MKEKELFDSLKDKVNDGVLPFDEGDWQQLRSRLDNKREKTAIAFVPSLWKYVLGGIAASAILFVLLHYRAGSDLKREDVVKKQPQENVEQVIDTAGLIAAEVDSPGIPAPYIYSKPASSVNTSLTSAKLYVPEKEIEIVHAEDKVQKQDIKAEEIIAKSTNEEKEIQVPKKQEYADLSEWNEDLPRNTNRPVFVSGGGVNYQSQNLGYAVKIGLDKPVSSRFSVNAELAVNTNSRNFSIYEASVMDQPIVGNGGTYSFHDTTYNRIDKEFAQAFAQAMIGFNYKLYSKGKAGMSVDALRIMRSKRDVEEFNSFLKDGKTTPLWNVGLRLQYTQYLNHHFDVGASYRQDVSGTINKNWQNNFLQLMVIYKLNEKR